MRNWIPLIQQYKKIVPNKNVVIESLSAFFMDFFFFFLDFLLAVNWTHPFIVRVEDSFSVSLREPYREKGEQDLLLRSHLPSQELQARTVGKQLDFLFCVWEAVDLKWLRKCENSMNVVCRVAEGLQLLQAFCFNLTCL